jgi:hypothetical protein
MTATPPEDVAALFDLPPPAAESRSATDAAEAAAAEAALAVEIASTIESGAFAADAPDSRTKLRVDVSWPARMRLPDGHVIDLHVRNISEAGVGLTSEEPLPAYTVVSFEMGVPPLDGGGGITPVEGTIKTTYTVLQGALILCGGTWVEVPASGVELVNRWIRRLQSDRQGPTPGPDVRC